jgi:hypothetical protein
MECKLMIIDIAQSNITKLRNLSDITVSTKKYPTLTSEILQLFIELIKISDVL